MTSGRMFPVYVSLLLWLASARETASLQCYSCKDVDSSDSCKNIAMCSGQQQCYTREKTIGRNKTFSMGCTNKQSCGPIIVQTMSAERPTEKCYECCGSDRCNSRLCNHPEPPPCIDKEKDCSFWNEKYNVCLNIHESKFTCRKYCNLCSLVDGNWAKWSQWSGCDVTCGRGKHTRTRTCTNPAPADGGWDCYGDSIDTKPCDRELCPVHGGWSDWSSWGSCPVTCGMGIQKRHRKCTDPVPLRYGNHCFGDSMDVQLCTRDHCGDTTSDPVAFNAYFVTDRSPVKLQTMVFSRILTNLGGAYNNSTGVFVVPRNGTYMFNAQLCANARTNMHFDIMVVGIPYATAYGYSANSCDCRSVQAIANLKTNDNVSVKWNTWSYSTVSYAMCHGTQYRNYFSGSYVTE